MKRPQRLGFGVKCSGLRSWRGFRGLGCGDWGPVFRDYCLGLQALSLRFGIEGFRFREFRSKDRGLRALRTRSLAKASPMAPCLPVPRAPPTEWYKGIDLKTRPFDKGCTPPTLHDLEPAPFLTRVGRLDPPNPSRVGTGPLLDKGCNP